MDNEKAAKAQKFDVPDESEVQTVIVPDESEVPIVFIPDESEVHTNLIPCSQMKEFQKRGILVNNIYAIKYFLSRKIIEF